MAIDSYANEFGEYPPDGYDYPVYTPNGIQLKGSACLTYFLAWVYPDGDGSFVEEPLYPLADLLSIIPEDNRIPFDVRQILARVVDGSRFHE